MQTRAVYESYWHLHFELILVEPEQEVRQSPLEQSSGTQHQNQVQDPWK